MHNRLLFFSSRVIGNRALQGHFGVNEMRMSTKVKGGSESDAAATPASEIAAREAAGSGESSPNFSLSKGFCFWGDPRNLFCANGILIVFSEMSFIRCL